MADSRSPPTTGCISRAATAHPARGSDSTQLPHRIDAAPDGGVVATLLGTPPRAVRIDRDGTVRWRVPLASADVSYHFDRSGAALVLGATGALRALAPDGSERWQLGLNTRVLLPAVVNAVGTLLVATTRGDLIRLRP
jgi:hypothetical protein